MWGTLWEILFYVGGIAFVTATIIPVIQSRAWWIRSFDFPRVQLLALGVVSLLFFAISDVRTLTTVTYGVVVAGACLYQFILIFPYTRLSRVEAHNAAPSSEVSVRLFIANVYMPNDRYAELSRMIIDSDANVVLLTEVDDAWCDEVLQLVRERFEHRILCPQDNTYGMLLLSRLPLANDRIEYVVEDGVPSFWTEMTMTDGKHIRFVGLHPRPPRPDIGQDTDERDAELIRVARRLKDDDGSIIVAGDLNDVAWSRTTRLFQRISGLSDPRKGRGFFNTYHARIPVLRYPLDHIFHSGHFRVNTIARLSDFGSDHYPIFVDLSFEPHRADRRLEPEASDADLKEGDDILEDAEV